MARILYVDDNKTWRDLVERRLIGHHIDSVGSLKEAVELLDSGAPYNLALVDLNLETDSDRQGGELLDFVRIRYPSTRRIVITGNPPAGSMREGIFDRYHVEEIIIKSDLDVPDLRRIVEEAIEQGAEGLSHSLKLARSFLRQRFRDWQGVQRGRLRNDRRAAEEHLYDAAKVSGPSRQRAQMVVDKAKQREKEFEEVCDSLRAALAGIRSDRDLDAVFEALDAAEEQFGERQDPGGH